MTASTPTLPPLPALMVGKVHHVRLRPIRHAFTYRQFQWLVDLGGDYRRGLPRPQDHFDSATSYADLRDRLVTLAADHGVAGAAIDRVLMLAHAPVLGHVFDPMSAYWLLDSAGDWLAIVLEVRNTYGGRHNYVLVPDSGGRASVAKRFYVSPFNDVSGTYDVHARLSETEAKVTIRLIRDGVSVFVAATSGRLMPMTRREVWRTRLRQPLMPQRVSALIRVHGIYLWLRRLPVHPRSKRTAP